MRAKLSEEQRRFIVTRLACFDMPSEIAVAIKEEFGIDVPRQRIHEYDPAHGEPAKKWRILFEYTRAEFLKDASKVPIAQKSYRLRELHKLYIRTVTAPRPNVPLGKELLEQAAKESGGMFTNRREITGKDGEKLIPEPSLDDLSDADLAALAAQLASRA